MNRRERILRHIDVSGQGVEIGPSHNPVTPKSEGYRVHIIDHMNRKELIEKYTTHQVSLEKIEEVDFVWNGETYSDLTGKSKYYDWIIASHVIEHTPDLIGFLNDCDSILKDDGVLSLVIPDKRYCFDHYRPITGLAKIIDSYYQRNKIHTPGTVVEYFLNAVSKSGKIAWNPSMTGECNFVHTIDATRQKLNMVLNEKTYIDLHAWCFVPHSFRLIIHDLFCLGLIPFQEIGFSPTDECEFYVALGRTGKGIKRSRLEMVNMIESELMV